MSDLLFLFLRVNLLDLLAKLQYAVSAAPMSRLPRYRCYIDDIIVLMNKKEVEITNLYFSPMYLL